MGGVSPLFRVASHYFSEFFNFGLVEFKDVEKLRSTFQSYPDQIFGTRTRTENVFKHWPV